MDLKGIMLNEISQRNTNTLWYHLYVKYDKKKTQKNNKHDEERVSHVLLTVVVTSRDNWGGGIVSLRD